MTLVKVGMTQRSVVERAKELSSATGVPSPFIVMFEEEVNDAGLAERLVHEKLKKYRVNERREFFDVPMSVAMEAVLKTCTASNEMLSGLKTPRLLLHYPIGANSKRFLSSLASVLKDYRGGMARVSVMYEELNASAALVLGRKWDVHFCKRLINSLRKIHGLPRWYWTGTLASADREIDSKQSAFRAWDSSNNDDLPF